jgi:hypothetical protein
MVGRQYIESDDTLSAICMLIFTCSKIDFRYHYTHNKGRGNTTDYGQFIAQAGSHRHPIKETRVRAHVGSCAICGGQSDTEAGFSEYLGFPSKFSFHQMLHTHLSSGAGTKVRLMSDIPRGVSLTPPHEIN